MAGSNGSDPRNGAERFYKDRALAKLLDLPEAVALQNARIETLEKRWRNGWKVAFALFIASWGTALGLAFGRP